ncbi:MAG: SMP-30/gluconolactonase/LRE family protein [Propionibacterium sp.]|nr:SMP-30/gluconolactonase/LRE family protein [Propionibacterium sp.]
MDYEAAFARVGEAVSGANPLEARELATGFSWSEIPRWHDGALWFSDMYNHCILRLAEDGSTEKRVDAAGRIALAPEAGGGDKPGEEIVLGGMGWLPDGRLITNSMHERVVLTGSGTDLTVYADLRELAKSSLNDMVVDADGRAYITQLGYDLFVGETPDTAPLLAVEPDGTARRADEAGEFAGANGITITADGSRLILAEVDANQITVLDRAADGTLSNRRTFAPTPWLPDGICLDEQGGVWAGMPGCGYVGRFVEGGRMTDAIALPMDRAMGTAVVLGGANRSTLYIACGMEVFDRAKSRDEGLGSIWAADTPYTAGDSRP